MKSTLTALLLLFATAATAAELPAGTPVTVKLADYVNTEHQPAGFTMRGITEGDVSAGGSVVIPDKSRVLMRLVPDPATKQLTVELWAVKFGAEWSEFRQSGMKSGLFTALKSVDDPRKPSSDNPPLRWSGPLLYVPFSSVMHFGIAIPVSLQNVGSYKP